MSRTNHQTACRWLGLFALASLSPSFAEPAFETVTTSEAQFQPLNPARGDASPKAGVLWGDIKKDVASGALIQFAEGFSSPPHIHNITYRGVVISGAVHNDDPDAAKLWMGPGSFWTQPAGEPHITAAAPGGGATAFLEILSGPYLVKPTSEAFDIGQRPLNLDSINVVWLDSSDVSWVEDIEATDAGKGVAVAVLWGQYREGHRNGTFLKLSGGTDGVLSSISAPAAWLRAVLISGILRHQSSGEPTTQRLEPGSYFGSKGAIGHRVSCRSETECLLYVSAEGQYRFEGHSP